MKVAGLVLTGGGERKERRIEIEELFLPRNSSTLLPFPYEENSLISALAHHSTAVG